MKSSHLHTNNAKLFPWITISATNLSFSLSLVDSCFCFFFFFFFSRFLAAAARLFSSSCRSLSSCSSRMVAFLLASAAWRSFAWTMISKHCWHFFCKSCKQPHWSFSSVMQHSWEYWGHVDWIKSWCCSCDCHWTILVNKIMDRIIHPSQGMDPISWHLLKILWKGNGRRGL